MNRKGQSPKISVVIPTRNRVALAKRAIKSALLQSYPDIEVIVIVDGGSGESYEEFFQLTDSRIRVYILTRSVGGGEARNIGIRESRGEWIALLDDDDEWLPGKLAAQMEAAASGSVRDALICCQYFERTTKGQSIRPRRVPKPGQVIGEYLFCEIPMLGARLTFLQTSTWLAPRSLFLRHPFDRGVRMNDDTDWLLRSIKDTSRQITIIQKPLSIYHCDDDHDRMNTNKAEIAGGEISRSWAKSRGDLFSAKALAYFFVTDCLTQAVAARRGWRIYMDILKDCSEMAIVSPMVLWLFFRATILFPGLKRCLPDGFRKRLRSIHYSGESVWRKLLKRRTYATVE